MWTTRIGTTIDHTLGVEVEAHLESPQRAPKRSADLETSRRYDSPFNGRPPGKVAFGQVHWEQTLSIGRQDCSGCQVTADRDYVVGAGSPRVRKPEQAGLGFDRQARTFQRDETLPVRSIL